MLSAGAFALCGRDLRGLCVPFNAFYLLVPFIVQHTFLLVNRQFGQKPVTSAKEYFMQTLAFFAGTAYTVCRQDRHFIYARFSGRERQAAR